MLLVTKILLAAQAVLVVLSLLGYGIFSNFPNLLATFDPEATFYIWAFQGFAIINIVLGGAAVLGESYLRNGIKIMVPFGLVYAISLLAETGGTSIGVPFGKYEYTHLLGWKLFDKVPLIIPLSWFTMAWPAWVLARKRSKGLTAVLLGSTLLVAWDLVLDPAMSGATTYWVWAEPGSYYGMPWRNLLGWIITGLVLLAVLAKTAPEPKASVSFATYAYLINLALPLGMSVLNGYWIASAAGLVTALGALAVAGVLPSRKTYAESLKEVPHVGQVAK